MKIITFYICETCGLRYKDRDAAIMCEAKGKAPVYPIGMIYGDHSPGAFYRDITFAVAGNQPSGHANEGASWACRNNHAGDSIDKQDLCGGTSLRPLPQDAPKATHPTFARMVKLLKSFGFTEDVITVWDGFKPVSLKEYVS